MTKISLIWLLVMGDLSSRWRSKNNRLCYYLLTRSAMRCMLADLFMFMIVIMIIIIYAIDFITSIVAPSPLRRSLLLSLSSSSPKALSLTISNNRYLSSEDCHCHWRESQRLCTAYIEPTPYSSPRDLGLRTVCARPCRACPPPGVWRGRPSVMLLANHRPSFPLMAAWRRPIFAAGPVWLALFAFVAEAWLTYLPASRTHSDYSKQLNLSLFPPSSYC